MHKIRKSFIKKLANANVKKTAEKIVMTKETAKGVVASVGKRVGSYIGRNKIGLGLGAAGAAAMVVGAKIAARNTCGKGQYFNKVTKSCISKKK